MPHVNIGRCRWAYPSFRRTGTGRSVQVYAVSRDRRHFQWDDGRAAHQYRLIQARNLITVYVEVLPGASQDPVQVYVSLAEDRQEVGGGYRRIRDVLADPEMRARLVDEALADFERAKAKYGRLAELAEVFEAVDRVRAARETGQVE